MFEPRSRQRTMPRMKAKRTGDCNLCPHKIRAGTWIALYFDEYAWVHVGCLIRKLAAGEDVTSDEVSATKEPQPASSA